MGELSGIQEPTNKMGQAEVRVVKESLIRVAESMGTQDRKSELSKKGCRVKAEVTEVTEMDLENNKVQKEN